METTVDEKKITLRNKIGYGLGEAGCQCSGALIGSYLTLYFTDSVGLSAATIAVIMLIARIWDAANDPMFGGITEQTRFKKFGRYRGWILIGTPIMAILNVLVFFKPSMKGMSLTLYCAIIYILFGTSQTVVSISTGALANSMTTSPSERTTLYSWRSFFGNLAMVLLSAITMPLILYFGNGSTSNARGYLCVALVAAGISIPLLLGCVANTEEVILDHEKKRDKKGGSLKAIIESFKIVFSDHDTRLLVLANIFIMLGQLGRAAISSYYFVYVLDAPLLSATCGTAMVTGTILTCTLAPSVMKRINKKTTGLLSAVLISLGYIGYFFVGQTKATAVLVPLAFVLGLVNMIQPAMYSLLGDIVDDSWIRTGKRTDGVMFSTCTFATKLGNAFGGSVGILLLSASGFVANSNMSAATLTKINATINIAPCVLVILGGLCFAAIRITNKKALENEKIIRKMKEAEN